MKKFILFILITIIPLNVSASVAVMDMDTKRLLYGDNANTEMLIASTTKIMTSLIVIQNADLDEEIEVSESVLRSYGSGIYVEVGEHIKIIDLLYGLMLRSGNDAAIILAEHVGGSMEGFALLMNEMAASLGMKNTHFINSSGLEDESGEGNMSTASDMAILMSYAMKNETLSKIMSTKHYEVQTDYKYYDWYNKNKLLTMYKYTTGGKTGYTKLAYRTLVTSASKDDKNLCVVTLNESNDFNKHMNFYEEYFKKYKLVNIIDSKTFLRDDDLYVEDDFNMLLNDSEIPKVKINVTYTNDAIDRIGYVTVTLNDEEYHRQNIYENKNTKKVSFFDKIKRFLTNIFG